MGRFFVWGLMNGGEKKHPRGWMFLLEGKLFILIGSVDDESDDVENGEGDGKEADDNVGGAARIVARGASDGKDADGSEEWCPDGINRVIYDVAINDNTESAECTDSVGDEIGAIICGEFAS